jgi:hypothetical protein
MVDVTREDFVLPTLAPVLAGFADELDNGREVGLARCESLRTRPRAVACCLDG